MPLLKPAMIPQMVARISFPPEGPQILEKGLICFEQAERLHSTRTAPARNPESLFL